MLPRPFEKMRWGRWGNGKLSYASSDRMAARRVVPVATQKVTGIDSKDEGVPFPPKQQGRHCLEKETAGILCRMPAVAMCCLVVALA